MSENETGGELFPVYMYVVYLFMVLFNSNIL